MIGKADFTPEEWWLLRETPLRVGAAVMVAAPSGTGGTLHEIIANATALANASKSFPDSDLIKMLTEPEDKELAYHPSPAAEGDASRHAREDRVTKDTLDMCRRVADLLDHKAREPGRAGIQEMGDASRWRRRVRGGRRRHHANWRQDGQ